jgi:hypothetical protein
MAEYNSENILLKSLLNISPRNIKLATKSDIFLKVNVKQSPYRPGQALVVPQG